MTQEENKKSRSYQTGKAAVEYAYGLTQSEERRKYCIEDFEAGVEWADTHMPTLYVVTRCEEHSDYVEKVFIDKNKAEEYCKQFEGYEDAYGRNITEINATL